MENFHSSCWILVRLQKTSATIFLFYLFIAYPSYYESFFSLIKEISEKRNVEQILRDCFGEPCELAKKKIPAIEKDIVGMYEEFKGDNGGFVNRKFDENYRLSSQHVLCRYEHSLANFVKTGYLHQYEYIENKYPEAIRVEEEKWAALNKVWSTFYITCFE